MYVQVNHEIPLSLIDEHQDFISDYMFVLLHKILEDEQYANTVLDFSDHGEIIYLDNSCFELGESLDNKLLYEWYQRIEPEYVVLPDVLGDYRRTLQRSIEFANDYPETIPNGMPVIQGSTPDEMIDCYNEFTAWGEYTAYYDWFVVVDAYPEDYFIPTCKMCYEEGVSNYSKSIKPMNTKPIKELEMTLDKYRKKPVLNNTED